MKTKEAVVLAGGVGSRLMPLTSNRPKPLVPIANRPILDYAIDLLEVSGIDKAMIVVKYLGDQIREHLHNYPRNEIDFVIPNVDPLDTADAVRKVSDRISGPFAVTMADILTNIDLADFTRFNVEKGGMASITLKPVDTPLEYGVIILNGENRIKLFLEKPIPTELYVTSISFLERETAYLHSNLINTGIYAFNPQILEILEQQPDLMDFGKHVFPFLLAKSLQVYGYVSDYFWLDIGNAKIYLKANWEILKGECSPYSDQVLSKKPQKGTDPVWIGENTKIPQTAQIVPPVLIGDNVTVRNSAKIGPFAVIGDSCIIERKSIIQRSVLWENVTVGEEAKMNEAIACNDSVLGEKSELKSYSIIGDHSAIGREVHVSPNVKIWPSVVIEDSQKVTHNVLV